MRTIFTVTYGSHLYGTNTPTSDTDLKVIYLPYFRDTLLGKKANIFKRRVDAQGEPVPEGQPMPDGGTETEFIPLQTFCRDLLNGQTYALEVAFAHLAEEDHVYWVGELVDSFLTANVSSMAGFAMKQTFDYVHRGERLEKARLLLKVLDLAHDNIKAINDAIDVLPPEQLRQKERVAYRLDAVVHGEKLLHTIARATKLELGTTVNNGRTMETLKLNGREYLETTDITHLAIAVEKLVDSYGHRSQAAAETEVDRKSLMHAVRVYQQAIELLETGKLTFPRPNREELLAVKTTMPLEEAKALLLRLEGELAEAVETNKAYLPYKTESLVEEFDDWLFELLQFNYGLR